MEQRYRMILVDDEDDVRGRILSKINPDSGFDVVGKAGNGYDAINLIEEHNPHVVLTDIKMPFIDGLELARIIRRDYPTTKVAFISGYDEFDLAREAIELNVISYLMKPVTAEDIEDFLRKLRAMLDQEFDLLSSNQRIQTMYQESIPMLIHTHLNNFRFQQRLTDGDIALLEQYGLSMVDGHHVVGMVAGVGYDDLVRSSETRIVLETLIEKVFSHLSFVRHFQVPEGIVFVLRDDALVAVDAIDLDLYEILKYAEEYRDTSLAIGISSGFQRFHEYPKAYREAEQALRHARYFYMGQIMYYDDIEVRERRNIEIEDSLMTTFEQAMKYGEKKDILQAIETLLQLAVPDAEEYIIDPQLLWIKMANSLINYAASIAVNISEVVEGDLIDHMARFSDMDEVKAYLYDIILRLRQSSVNVQVTRTERIIEEVYQYIETHYADPTISLETVTQALGISISYLSMLLKKHRGVTYTKELIRYRMEQAKELLKTTNLKIVSIAKQVGYHEVYYFSHSFKRHTGMSPREFRERG